MAPWVLYALTAAVIVSVVTVIDKTVLSKWMARPSGSFFAFGVVETFIGVVALLALGVPRLPLPVLAAALATGAGYAAATLFYFRALKVEEASRVVPLYNLSPIVTALLAAAFLGEIFGPGTYAGVALVVVGAVMLSLKRVRGWRFGKGIAWMLVSVLCVSVSSIVSKGLLGTVDPWTLFAYGKLGTAFVALPASVDGAHAFFAAVRRHGKRVAFFTALSEGLTSIVTIFFLLAASTGYVTLVSALIGAQPLFLLIITSLLSVYRPDILKEELSGPVLLRKIAAIACLLLGVAIIA